MDIAFPLTVSNRTSITGLTNLEKFSGDFGLYPLDRQSLPGGFFYLRGLPALLNKGSYDCVVFQASSKDISSFNGFLTCKRRKLPFIWWNKGFADESHRPWLAKKVIFEPFSRMPDLIIPYGDRSVEYFRSMGVPSKRIIMAYNTVDVEGIAARRNSFVALGENYLKGIGIKPNGVVISTVGRLAAKKRVKDLIFAVSHLVSRDLPVTCLIGGAGEEFERLGELVSELKLSNVVHILGRLPEEMDNGLLAVSDAAVFCGGHGLAINQAMALRTLVFCAEESGPDSEMVVEGETGFLFKKGNSTMLADRLQNVLFGGTDVSGVCDAAFDEIVNVRNESNYAESFRNAFRVIMKNNQ